MNTVKHLRMKTRKMIVAGICLCLAQYSYSQERMGVTHSGHITGQPPFPVEYYSELPNPAATDNETWRGVSGVSVNWGSKYVRYAKESKAKLPKDITGKLKGWKGEKVSAQLVIASAVDLENVSVEITAPLHVSGKYEISSDCILKGFVRYVMTDELNHHKAGTCGDRPDASRYDSTLVADPIDHLTLSLPVAAKTSQGYWVGIRIPRDALAGTYKSDVTLKNGTEVIGRLKLELQVLNHTLPAPAQWAFHLDLWQNPFAVARYYGVQPWSKEHFALLKKELKPYADAGGKVVTASIIHQPWNAQTYDPFETMVTWMKRVDGTWMYDYTVFDRWVEFMRSMGVTRAIGCYSMIPWRLSFQYYDQATNSLKELHAKPGEQVYRDFWLGMLKDFAAHLKSKGWFDITHIAMDERPMKDMQEALSIIREADADFKVSLAGALHDELSDELDDYCVALRMKYSESLKRKRRSEGKITTYYTCCEESYPNTYTFSNPAEAEWLGWYAAKENLDGYLRWALNSWTIEPLLDSRFYSWGAGDTYLLYPGGRTSMRFENLLSGIQAYEKIRILKQEWERNGNVKKLAKLERILRNFDEHQLKDIPADRVVEQANLFINTL